MQSAVNKTYISKRQLQQYTEQRQKLLAEKAALAEEVSIQGKVKRSQSLKDVITKNLKEANSKNFAEDEEVKEEAVNLKLVK